MSLLEAIILGIIQGLTEFLPVSSSGHLELGKAILGVEIQEDLGFTVIVHLATVLSTITVFRKDILTLGKSLFTFQWNENNRFTSVLVLSAIPVLVVGLFLEDEVEQLFSGSVGLPEQMNGILFIVGIALLVTATLLALSSRMPSGEKKKIGLKDGIIIGIAQAFAVIPGLSRSGSTIATALLLKNDREQAARFSFLMVLIPILGASFLKILEWIEVGSTGTEISVLVAGFFASYISGLLACRWMVSLIKRGKLIWFAFYCLVVGSASIIISL